MPVQLFTDGIEPTNADAPVWRFLDVPKFEDLFRSSELYFNRADLFSQDDQEGLAPEDYIPILRLNRHELNDAMKLNDAIAFLKQQRESFYVSCWHLFQGETGEIWTKFGPIAICTTYRRLKAALELLDASDEPHLGLVRYGSNHLTRWNVMQFITTKREQFEDEREVRALLWIRDQYAGMNRQYDLNNFPHDGPLTPPPPDRVKDFHRRRVDLKTLVTDIVLSPWTTPEARAIVEAMIRDAHHAIPIRESVLARHATLLPTADELRRFT